MFTETRTTVAEVLTDVHREVNYHCNSVINGVWKRTHHPTYITKRALKDSLSELDGMVLLAIRVSGGVDQLPTELRDKIEKAREAVRTSK